MLLKHLRILLSFSGLHKLFSSLIYELCLYIFLSCSSLRLCFVSMRLSLGAPDNTLILPSSSSKSLSLCSNLIPLLPDCFSRNLLWNKMWGCKNIWLPARSHLPVDIWYIQHFLKQSVNVKSFVAYTDASFGFIRLVNFFISEPIFVDAHVIPDGTDPNDAKIYFFFKERLTDNSGSTKQIHSMIARVCPVRTVLFARLLG